MTMLNPSLSRRTFLGGAAASVVVAVTHSAGGILLPPAPLAANALIQDADALAGLEVVLASPHLDLRAILLAPAHDAETRSSNWNERRKKVTVAVRGILARGGTKLPVFELHSNDPRGTLSERDLGLPTLLLGSFSGLRSSSGTTNRVGLPRGLTRLLRASPRIYVDDPPLAAWIASAPELAAVAPRTVAGLCSLVDPAVDFSLSHLRSGTMGPIKQIFTSLLPRDAANRLEARAIHQRLLAGSSLSSFPSLHLTGVASVNPIMTLQGARGHLQIALYTPRDRHAMLPVRLQHFTSAALSNTES